MPARRARVDELEREIERGIKRRHRRTEVARNLALVFCFLGIWAQSFFGRQALVESQRGGCERTSRAYLLNGGAWRQAAEARRMSGDDGVASQYDRRARAFEELSGVGVGRLRLSILEGRAASQPRYVAPEIVAVCVKRYPSPTIFGRE